MSRLRGASAPLTWNALQLLGLNALIVARPYFQLYEDDPAEFIPHGVTASVIVAFALVMLLAIPAAMIVAELVAGIISVGFQRGLHLAFIGGFVALFVYNGLGDAAAGKLLSLAGALAAGAVAVLLYTRSRGARSWFSVLGAAPVVVALLFFGVSPVREFVFTSDGPAPIDQPSTGAPIVMLVFDEFPVVSLLDENRRIDAELYPNFARLARTATWYRQAATVADFTEMAVPAMLTGRQPSGAALRTAADHPDSLFRLLGGSYRLDVTDFYVDLCSRAACPQRALAPFDYRLRLLLRMSLRARAVLPHRVNERLIRWVAPDRVPPDPAPGPQPRSTRRVLATGGDAVVVDRFLSALGPSEGRTLNFAHLATPHTAWIHLPTGQVYAGESPSGPLSTAGARPKDPVLAAYQYRRHLAEVGYADHVLGQVMDRLESQGTFDDSLIVVAADHGAAFRPGEQAREATPGNVAQIAGVPLIIKAPREVKGRIVDTPVELTDLVPTVAAMLRTRIPWRVDGLVADRVTAAGRPELKLWRLEEDPLFVSRSRLTTLNADALDAKLSLFYDGNPFALGPLGHEIGREIGNLPAAQDTQVAIDNAEAYRDVDPGAPFVPAAINGTITSPRPGRRPLAIAINGRIVATTASTLAGRREIFSALVPSFDRGENEIEVLTEDGGRLLRIED